MTKRLDVPIPPTPTSVPQASTSPIPTSSSPFQQQQRLSTSALSPTTSMAQLTTNSPPVVSNPQDPLKSRLSEILNEQRALQQRKEELEKMVRKRRQINNSLIIDVLTLHSYEQIEQLIIGYQWYDISFHFMYSFMLYFAHGVGVLFVLMIFLLLYKIIFNLFLLYFLITRKLKFAKCSMIV